MTRPYRIVSLSRSQPRLHALAHPVRSVDLMRAAGAAHGTAVVAEQLEVVDGEDAELVPHLLAALRLEGDVQPAVTRGDVPRCADPAALLLELDIRERLARARRPDAGLFLLAGHLRAVDEVGADDPVGAAQREGS